MPGLDDIQMHPERGPVSTIPHRCSLLLLAVGLVLAGLVLPAAPAHAEPITPAPTPVLTGDPTPGENLVIDPGVWPEGVTLSYEWILDGVTEPGANGPAWTVRQQDIDVVFQGAVTGSKEGFDPVRVVSDPVTILGEQQVLRPTPTITGTPRFGAPLVASSGTWDDGVVLAYQWLRAGAPIAGAIATSYTPRVGDVGVRLSVRVTGAKPGYSRVVATSTETAPVASATFASARAAISGTAKVGKTLVAKVVGARGAKVTYAWSAGAKKVGGASRLKLAKAVQGKRITLRVTLTAPGFATRRLTAVTRPVAK